MRQERQALFVMAKQPKAGKVKTRLCPPLTPETAARLYECVLSDVLDLVASVPGVDPVVAFSPPEAHGEFARLISGRFQLLRQAGANLGARLENMFRVLFRQGHQRVAAVSTDSPDLPMQYLADAFATLEEAPVVLGPCPDGGYYLIGLSRLIPELFRNMPWSTEQLLRENEARAQRLGANVMRLPEWHDGDTTTDLDRLMRDLLRAGPSAVLARRTLLFCQQEFGGRHVVVG